MDGLALIAALPMPAALISGEERIVALSPSAEALLGPGLRGLHYITALRQPVVLDKIEAALLRGETGIARYLIRDPGGADLTFDVHCVPVQGHVVLQFEDVTPLHAAGQMRRDFVANVSHELRTPLTALLGFVETLRGPARDDAPARDRFLSIMETEALRMNRLVGDLLSLNRVEAVERQRPTDPVALAPVLSGLVHGLTPLAEAAGVVLQLDLPETEIIVPADEDQLRQVFTNLVENAIKYGAEGERVEITLHAPRLHQRLRTRGVEVEIRDFGPGIDEIHIPRLTERFYRIDTHRSREQGGTGLGLAIVKHIVNRHRGRLTIATKLGQGTRFSVLLPL